MFWREKLKKLNLCNCFWSLSENRSKEKRFSADPRQCILRLQRFFRRKIFFFGKLINLQLFSNLIESFRTVDGIFWQVFQKFNLRVYAFMRYLQRKLSWGKYISKPFSDFEQKNFRSFGKYFFSRVVKTAFVVSSETFGGNEFFGDVWLVRLLTFDNFFWTSFSVSRLTWDRNVFFLRKIITVSITSGVCSMHVWTFDKNCTTGLSKLHSTANIYIGAHYTCQNLIDHPYQRTTENIKNI